ncbi:hypothetical protein OROMI_006361 [Orobanche minor]
MQPADFFQGDNREGIEAHNERAMEKGGCWSPGTCCYGYESKVCRTLSYKCAEFEVVEVPLDANMMTYIYGKAAEFWAELRMELLSASTFLAEERSNSSQLWRLYWANHQVELSSDYIFEDTVRSSNWRETIY